MKILCAQWNPILLQEHTHKFYEAKEFYENGGKWNEAILGFEDTLKAYLEEMENCRLSCEKPFDQGWYPDFISSTASKT